MRAFGCAINDIADRRLDAQVARTKNRPLAAGDITVAEAAMVACFFLLAAFFAVAAFADGGKVVVAGGIVFCRALSAGKKMDSDSAGVAGGGFRVWNSCRPCRPA